MEDFIKHCDRCDASKVLAEFSKHKGTFDGYRKHCKDCQNTAARLRYSLNAEKERDRKKQEYLRNPNKTKIRVKKWSENNYDKYRAKVKDWSLANPDKVHDYRANRRAKKLANGIFKVTRKEIKTLLASQCFYCGSNSQISIDHVIPISRGGRHSIGNLVAACRSCNSRKNARFITEWKVLR